MVEHRPDNSEPLFTAWTEEDLEAKFGGTREAGRLSVAKANGFDTVEAMNTALSDMKELGEAKQRAADAGEELDQHKAELRAIRVEREARLQALDLGGTPQAISDILTLRQKREDVLGDGQPNIDGIRSSIEDVFNAHPQLRGGTVRSSVTTSTGGLVDGIKASLRERFQRL
jgi:hypothetical protein